MDLSLDYSRVPDATLQELGAWFSMNVYDNWIGDGHSMDRGEFMTPSYAYSAMLSQIEGHWERKGRPSDEVVEEVMKAGLDYLKSEYGVIKEESKVEPKKRRRKTK